VCLRGGGRPVGENAACTSEPEEAVADDHGRLVAFVDLGGDVLVVDDEGPAPRDGLHVVLCELHSHHRRTGPHACTANNVDDRNDDLRYKYTPAKARLGGVSGVYNPCLEVSGLGIVDPIPAQINR